MQTFESYIPTKVIFGPGTISRLEGIDMPGKKALLCVTEDQLMSELGIQQRVVRLLEKRNIEVIVYDKVCPNPTRKGVMEAAKTAREHQCEFFIGLGGGSSIDTAKAASIMMANPGDLWDYAQAGTGKRKGINGAFPVVTITTTAGTGTECDPWCVITNEETKEKLDFGTPAVFPAVSVIDPELMLTLPRTLSAYQGFDALFHGIECYIASCGSPLARLYCVEAVRLTAKWLPAVVRDGSDLEARTNISYAANVLCGFAQSLSATISPHIIGQCMSGRFPGFVHGASLIVTAREYYSYVLSRGYILEELESLGRAMGREHLAEGKGRNFIAGLSGLMDETGMGGLSMSGFGVQPRDLDEIAKISVGIGFDYDPYPLSEDEVLSILKNSYK